MYMYNRTIKQNKYSASKSLSRTGSRIREYIYNCRVFTCQGVSILTVYTWQSLYRPVQNRVYNGHDDFTVFSCLRLNTSISTLPTRIRTDYTVYWSHCLYKNTFWYSKQCRLYADHGIHISKNIQTSLRVYADQMVYTSKCLYKSYSIQVMFYTSHGQYTTTTWLPLLLILSGN
jgi:hypothetical protein